MLNKLKNKRIPLIILGVVLILVTIVLLVFNLLYFRITETYPSKNGVLSSSSRRITLTFNKSLDPKQDINSYLEQDGSKTPLSYSISDKNLYLFNQSGTAPLAEPGSYILVVNTVSSNSGDIVVDIIVDFKIDYQDFSDLPKAEQERQINESSSFKDPIQEKLPYRDAYYTIEYEFPDINSSNKPTLYIYMNFSAKGQGDDNNPYTRSVRKYRRSAIQKIVSWGFKPTDYTYRLGEDVLLKEFISDNPGIQIIDDFTGDGVPPENL